jgi:protein required for attachment to host cells
MESGKLVKGSLKTTSTPSGNVTLRFDGQVLEQLRNEADQKRISLNTLASQVFKTHAEFTGAAAKAGMVSFPKNLLIRIMDKLSEEEVKQLSHEVAKNEMKDMLLMMKQQYSTAAFVDLIESWIRVSGFPYTHNQSDNTHSFVIQHDMGRRWSIYLAELFKYVFSDLGAKWADFQMTENTVMFNVDV